MDKMTYRRKGGLSMRKFFIALSIVLLLMCTACSKPSGSNSFSPDTSDSDPSGSNRSYKIKVTSGADKIESIPKRAKAGEEVTITTLYVTDADMYVSVDGVVLSEKSVCEYVFTMPEHDVSVDVWIDTSNQPGS